MAWAEFVTTQDYHIKDKIGAGLLWPGRHILLNTLHLKLHNTLKLFAWKYYKHPCVTPTHVHMP